MADDFDNKRQDLFELRAGLDKVKGLEEKRQYRITNQMDLVTIFDGSAKEFNNSTWLNHLSAGGGHYYGNTAGLFTGLDEVLPSKPREPEDKVGPSAPRWGITWDIQKAMSPPWNNTMPVTPDPATQ